MRLLAASFCFEGLVKLTSKKVCVKILNVTGNLKYIFIWREKMRSLKRIVAFVMALALAFSGLYLAPEANAQVNYKTKGVYILTDLVPNDANIKVKKDGSSYAITAITNVQFDIDCNVDCSWKVTPDAKTEPKEGSDKVTIDSMGHVEIARGAATGTYVIEAEAKRIDNNDNTTASCRLTVDGDSTPAQATGIKLDKEAIESQVKEGSIVVAEDGKSMEVLGTVEKVKLDTIVSPEYILENEVNFECGNKSSVKLTEDVDDTVSLFTSLAETPNGIMLKATAGQDISSYEIAANIKSLELDAAIDCSNIPAGSTENKNGKTYTIRLNEDLDFYIEDNEEMTLPKRVIDNVAWTITDGVAKEFTGDTYECELGTFTMSDNGKHINLKTPVKDTSEYDDYVEALKTKKSITLEAQINYHESENVNRTGNITVGLITLSFINENNSFSQVGLDFATCMEENKDYVVKKETLNGKEVDVYYVESDSRKLDFAAMTQPNTPGVRDFEEARDKYFHGDEVKYTVTYSFSDVEDSSFGATEEAKKAYQNRDFLSGEINLQSLLSTNNRTLTKTGIGYKKVTVTTTGVNGKIGEDAVYYLRFVGDAKQPSVIHDYYASTDLEYSSNAVIHVRQGEADFPVVLNGSVKADVTRQNPYMEYTFEPLMEKTEGETIASATIDKNTSTLRINGLAEGKVKVTATSAVDKSQFDSYILYVNDEYYTPKSIQIDISDAVSKEVMTADGDVNGRVKDIQLDIRVSGTNAGVPKVKWESSDETFATITQDGKLTTLKSTGNDSVKITATSLADSSKTATLDLKIKDVPATGIRTISEKVENGKTPVITSSGENAGTCKAYSTFYLNVSDYEPQNATSATGKVTWSSGNEDVAVVDEETGKVTTLTEGKAVITATYSSGSSNTSKTTYNLTVSGFAEKVTGIKITPEKLVFEYVGLTQALTTEVLGTATDKSVLYESADPSIAKVTENGSVSAVSVGKTVITVTSVADPTVKKTVSVEVKGENAPTPGTGDNNNTKVPVVSPNPTKVELKASVSAAVIPIKGTAKISVTGANGAVTYTSSNPGVASVNGSGVVTGKKAGSVTITVKNGTSSAAVKVTVAKNPVIKLAKKTIKKKKSTKVKIQNKAAGAKVKYTLNKKSKKIVSVSKSGKITGKKKGTASVTVKVTQYGKTYTKKLTIKVK